MAALLDFLEWIGRPQQVVANVLHGSPGGALKQGAQFGVDALDAVLPGDWLPNDIAEDARVEGHELLGMDEDSHWGARLAADLGVGIATDPLTYLGFVPGIARNAAATGARTAARALAQQGERKLVPLIDDALKFRWEDDVFKTQVDDLIAAGTPKPEATKLATDTLKQRVRDINMPQIQAETVLPAQQAAVRGELQRGFSKAGRALKAEDKASILDDVLANAGDFSEEALGAAIKPHERYFTQGGMEIGVPFGPKKTLYQGKRVDPLFQMSKLFDKLPAGARDKLGKAGQSIAETANWMRPGVFGRTVVDSATAAGERSLRSASSEVKAALNNLDGAQREVLFDVFQGIQQQGDQFAAIPGAKTLGMADAQTQIQEIGERIARVAAGPEEQEQLLEAAEGVINHTMRQYAEAVENGLMFAPKMYRDAATGNPVMLDTIVEQFIESGASSLDDDVVDAFIKGTAKNKHWDELGDEIMSPEFQEYIEQAGYVAEELDPNQFSPGLYMQRAFSQVDDEGVDTLSALPAYLKSRSLKTGEQVADFLNQPGVSLQRDPMKALHGRSLQHAAGLKRAKLGQQLLGDDFKLYNKVDRDAMAEVVADVAQADPGFASVMQAINEGMPPRGAMMNFLAQSNRVFKPAAVFGYVLPKINTNMRNAMSQSWQALSVPEARFRTLRQLSESPGNVWKSFKDAYHDAAGSAMEKVGITQSGDDISVLLREVDEAFEQGGDVMANLQTPILRDALEYGVLDNFVTVEDLARAIRPSGKGAWKDWVASFDEFARRPGGMFQGVESRARLATFIDLVNRGYDPNAATQILKDAFLDYTIANSKNRALRDIIPFASFLTQTVKQQAMLANEKPAVAAALGHLFGGEQDDVTPEWIAGQANLPMGRDAEGNRMYATGLGLPPEALESIPNPSSGMREFGRDVKRGVVGSSHPLLKTLYSVVSGRDPYFDSPVGSYAKTPELLQAAGMPETSDLGREYQFLKSTGMIQPLASPMTTIDQALDDRKPLAARALSLLSGVKAVSVDEERARMSNLAQKLELDPTIKTMNIFYGDDENPLLQEYKDAQRARRRSRDMD